MIGCPNTLGFLFSGNANNGTNAGFVYSNSNNTPSNTNANIGSHLCYKSFGCLGIVPKNNDSTSVLVAIAKAHKMKQRL